MDDPPSGVDAASVYQRLISLEQRAAVEHAAMERYLNQRIETLQQAVNTMHVDGVARFHRQDESIEKAVERLRLLIETRLQALDERFKSVDMHFAERDIRFKQSDAASELAIAKSETATSKQIEQLGVLINTTRDSFATVIDDVKERISRIESSYQGRVEQRHETNSNQQLWIAVLALLATVIGMVIGFVVHVRGST